VHRGYTKRWRKRWDKKYHYDKDLWCLMDYFIDFANYKDSEVYFPNVGMISLKRGEHIFGTPQTSEFLRIDRSRLRRKLKILENIGFLTIRSTNKYSIATVINYDIYQPQETPDDHQSDQQMTSRRPSNDQQTTTPNKDNKEKKEKKVKKGKLEHPQWLDLDLWKSFKEHRQKLRAPMTQEAERRAIIKLSELVKECGCGPEDIIGQSLDNGWKGLFKLNKGYGSKDKQLKSAIASENWLRKTENG
jgi:hypothetical protein